MSMRALWSWVREASLRGVFRRWARDGVVVAIPALGLTLAVLAGLGFGDYPPPQGNGGGGGGGGGADLSDVDEDVAIRSDHALTWTDSTSSGGTADVALERAAAGTVQITDGSSGEGGLQIGNGFAPVAGGLSAGTSTDYLWWTPDTGRLQGVAGSSNRWILTPSDLWLRSTFKFEWNSIDGASVSSSDTSLSRGGAGVVLVEGALEVADTGLTLSAGDLAAGQSGSGYRLQWDSSAGDLLLKNSAGTVTGSLSSGGAQSATPWTIPTEATLDSLTWVNQGSASYSEQGPLIKLSAPAATGANLRVLVKNCGSTPWTATAGIISYGSESPANYQKVGIVARESSTGELITHGYVRNNGETLSAQRWNSATSHNGDYYSGFAVTRPSLGTLLLVRIEDDGTLLKFSYSLDGGLTFIQRASASRTAFFAGGADQVGIFFAADDTSVAARTHGLFHLELP